MSIRLSVIVPVYNGAAYLSEAVESAVGNGFPDLEILVIDDGSRDRSREIARELAERHPDRVRQLAHPHGENRGVSTTRNLGLEAARGEWVAFLDADDRYLPGHLAASVEVLESDPEVGLVYGRIRHIFAEGVREPEVPVEWGNHPDRGAGRGRVPEAFRRLLFGNFVPLATVVCRRESVWRAGGFDVGLSSAYEDYLLWTKIAYRDGLYFTGQCSSEYRVHPNSYTWNFARNRHASTEELEYLHKLWSWLPGDDPKGREALSEGEVKIGSRIVYRLYQALRNGDRAQAVTELKCLGRLPHRSTLLKVPGVWGANRRASRQVGTV